MKTTSFFQNHPLVFWLKDCVYGDNPLVNEIRRRSQTSFSSPVKYEEIFDVFSMSSLWNYIDPSFNVHQKWQEFHGVEFSEAAFQTLLDGVIKFYEVNLGQNLVTDLPDLQVLTGDIHQENFVKEIEKVALLLLNCAVQSDKKKIFIERITGFDNCIQSALADYIQQLSKGSPLLSSTHREKAAVSEFPGTSMKEKDALVGKKQKQKENDDGVADRAGPSSGKERLNKIDVAYHDRPISPSSEIRQLTLQVARLGHENRQLRTQSEWKDDECRKQEIELEEKTERIVTLENERLRLLKKDKLAKELEDDLQAALMRIEKLQPLESLEGKFRRAEEEKTLFESKYKAVEKKNKALEDVITELEKANNSLQIENNDRKAVENSLQRMKSTVQNHEREIATKNSEIEVLLEEKHRLEFELKEREERISDLETCSSNLTPRHVYSLANQLEDASKDELEIMKAEVRKLRAQTEGTLQDSEFKEVCNRVEGLKQQLEVEELQNAQYSTVLENMRIERIEIDGNMEKIAIELEETMSQVNNMRKERDDAVTGLHEARKKFSQFQLEFGKTLEEEFQSKHRMLNLELDDLKKDLVASQESEKETSRLIEKLKNENKKLRFELDEVREEKSRTECTINQLERSKKHFDAERETLKSKIITLEDDIESLKLQLLSSETTQRRLNEKDSTIECLHDEKSALENELRLAQQQLKIESKKTQSLREDLVLEKSRKADLIGTLRSVCTSLLLNGGNLNVEGMDDEELIIKIDDIMMNALVTVKRESDSLRIQQNIQIAELSDLKKDIEKLRRSESQSLNESDDRVRELTLENIQAKENNYLLQEKIRELNLELITRCNEIEIAKQSIEDLHKNLPNTSSNHAELAKLQALVRNSEIKEDIAKQENTSLIEELEKKRKIEAKNIQSLNELEAMHKALLADHTRLQQLHNFLTRDYDEAKHENLASKQKLYNVEKNQKKISTLEAKLADEIDKGEQQNKKYAELKKNHKLCSVEIEKLRRHIHEADAKRDEMRLELHRVSESTLVQRNSINTIKQVLASKELEVSKLSEKLEAMTQLNQTHCEENKNLSRQLEIILTQNKELLQRALHDKDQYHLEMTDYQDQLTALRRHKEKLEEKIMDQYRTMESKKQAERKQPLVKRAAKALINRRRAVSNGGSTTEDSSVYSADELSSSLLADDQDNIPPTCSSSDDRDTIPPNIEVFICPGNSVINSGGGYLSSEDLRQATQNDLPSPNDYLMTLSSRSPLRNRFATSSLRTRPPPPPYNVTKKNKTMPALKASRSQVQDMTVESILRCNTNEAKQATPTQKTVVMEGHMRDSIRDKDERTDKTLSFYENVNNSFVKSGEEFQPNEATVWYEYGCV